MTKSTTVQTIVEAEIVVEYGPVRPNHENRLLTALTEFNDAGLVIESSFETGQFSVCIELTGSEDELALREIIKNTLNEAYGEVAVAKAKVSVDFDSYEAD